MVPGRRSRFAPPARPQPPAPAGVRLPRAVGHVVIGLVAIGPVACAPLDRVPVLDGEACAPARTDIVGCVLDGDTLRLGDCNGEDIRLLGINAPEISHDGNPAECYGDASARWLSDLLTNETVTLRFDDTCTDTYGRTLAYVYHTLPGQSDEYLVNEASVREGQSRVFEDFDDILLATVLYSAQDYAQNQGVGLWGACE